MELREMLADILDESFEREHEACMYFLQSRDTSWTDECGVLHGEVIVKI